MLVLIGSSLYYGGRAVMTKHTIRSAFTIVELIVVISAIAILAIITIVSYGAWRTQIATNSVKSDLGNAASAMESARTFASAYPLTIPSTFVTSTSNTITLTLPDTKSFCIDGVTTQSTSINYYIDNLTQINGATSGTCAARTMLPLPGVIVATSFVSGVASIVVNWTVPSPNYASQYLVRCALDQGFITGVIEQTVAGGTTTAGTVSGVKTTTTYYCRARAINANGQSDWSNTVTGNTQ